MKIPVDKGLDNTLDLLTEGYHFIREKSDELQTEIFETRVMGKKMVCMSGKDAVEVFYNNNYFQREGAVPKRIQKTLFGEHGIQTMDGVKHKIRKQMFNSLMEEPHLDRLSAITKEQWKLISDRWADGEEVILFDETEEILCRVACLWAGIPLKESEVKERAYDLGALIDAIGGIGPRYQEGRKARKKTESWIESIIEKFREGAMEITEGTAIHTIGQFQDELGKPLDSYEAAVELINVLRPVVAVARFVIFSALALHDYPKYKELLTSGNDDFLENFVQEVRRYYPFAPFLGAMVRKDFVWKGYSFTKGTTVLIDLYGTNHDADLWDQPNEFRPERFSGREENMYDFVPQGGGDPNTGHRCPGEKATVIIMKTSLLFLVNDLNYKVIEGQDLSVSYKRIPTLPKSRFVIRKTS